MCNHMDLEEKIKNCAEQLSLWRKEITDNFGQRIKICKNILKQLKHKKDQEFVRCFKEEQEKKIPS